MMPSEEIIIVSYLAYQCFRMKAFFSNFICQKKITLGRHVQLEDKTTTSCLNVPGFVTNHNKEDFKSLTNMKFLIRKCWFSAPKAKMVIN